MATTRSLLVIGGITATLMLGACGESQETDAQYAAAGGATAAGEIGRTVSDPGILKDPTSYQPTEPPTGGGTIARTAVRRSRDVSGEGAGPDAGGEAAKMQVQYVVDDLISALADGEAMLALKLFTPEHVAELTAGPVDTLFNTFEKIERLALSLEERLDPEKAASLVSELRGPGNKELEIELLDERHATVKPDLARILFGNVKWSSTMSVVKSDGQWRFELDAPLTAQQATEIQVYHNSLQVVLDDITDWVESSGGVAEERLRDIFAQALEGEPVDLGAAETVDRPSEDTGGRRVRTGGGRTGRTRRTSP